MGSFSLSLFKKVIPFLLMASANAKVVSDVTLSDQRLCGGTMVPLQAAGLRTATFLKIRVYVVAYYSLEKVLKGDDPNKKKRPICFELTYLRDVSDKDVDRAWQYQFKESSDFPYPKLDEHVNKLKEYFSDIKDERTHLFELVQGKTILSENGKVKGEIDGDDFQKNFLSVWFGKNPPTEEVKENLLK